MRREGVLRSIGLIVDLGSFLHILLFDAHSTSSTYILRKEGRGVVFLRDKERNGKDVKGGDVGTPS